MTVNRHIPWYRRLWRWLRPPKDVAGVRYVDMTPLIAELNPDTSQFTTMLMRLCDGPPPTWAEQMAKHRAQVELWGDWDDIYAEPKEPQGLMGQKFEWLEDELLPRFRDPGKRSA